MSRFDGKVAIVTGAATGLGSVMAGMLADEGARVVIVGRRLELLEATAARIGGAAIAVRADVTRESDVTAMVDTVISAFGHVDVLMNNAAQPGTDKFIW